VRIFFLSFTPPVPSWGGAMTFHRHFIERNDFQTLVATNSRLVDEYPIAYSPVRFVAPAWWCRLERTRYERWICGFQDLYGAHLLPRNVFRAAEAFRPDVVFTVAGSWDWTALAAQQVARRLSIPLVASFNDWYDYGSFRAHPSFRSKVESRFRQFYHESDLALCTCEGMRDALGGHANTHILYPTGALMPRSDDGYGPEVPSRTRPFTVFFGGSLGDWYGLMLESLVTTARETLHNVRFRIFGSLQTWSTSFESWAAREGIYGGYLPFSRLSEIAAQCDLLLLPMGFGDSCAQVERTSFKTKFLDYLSFRRPILVWGPEYCTAVRVAREYDSAECVTSAEAYACATAIGALAAKPERRAELMANAQRMYYDRFHPDKIHAGLVTAMRKLCAGRTGS
jgi:glycosyltransferase involved in cell wall biosynthesis